MKVIDATDSIAGRVAATAAKLALEGEQIVIVNAEKALISGNPKAVIKDYLDKIHRGERYQGPFYPKMPDRVLRRIIRGMLPYKKDHGRSAFKRIKVYIGIPDKYKDKGDKLIKTVRTERIKKFITLNELSKRLGARV